MHRLSYKRNTHGGECHGKEDFGPFSDDDYDKKCTISGPSVEPKVFEFLLLFDLAAGSPKVNYFMVDPIAPSRLLPKMNTIKFNTIKGLIGYRPVVVNNCLYLLGGKDWKTGICVTTVWKFDPCLNLWSSMQPFKTARCRFTAVAVAGYIYIIGGETSQYKVTDSVERYDPLDDKWTQVSVLPEPRADHASCTLSNCIFVSGGICSLRHQCSNVFWIYDPREDTWKDASGAMPQERAKHKMVAVGKTKIFFLQGRGFDQENFMEKDVAEVCHYNLDGTSDHEGMEKPFWDKIHPSMLHPHSNGATVVLGRYIWTLGGLSYTKGVHNRTVSYYDTQLRRWRDVFHMPEGSFSNVDCCLLKIPVDNEHFCFLDRFLYDRWILW